VKITKLNISNCIITNIGLYYISYLTNIKILEMTLRNGMTTEGFDYLYKLKHLNEISIELFGARVIDDVNLSPLIIEKFVNIKEFQFFVKLKPVDGVKGFLYVRELRRQKEKN
jgi:hypothetical protein